MTKTARDRRRAETEERRVLLEGLSRTRVQLAQAYASFNAVSDPELIDSYSYEILALRARYGYLLRQIKGEEGALCPEGPDRPDTSGRPGGEIRRDPPRKKWRPVTAFP